MGKPRRGTLEPAGTWPDGTLRFRARLRLGDGTKSDRIELEAHFADERQARDYVAGMQAIEDTTHELLDVKRAKAARAAPPSVSAAETCDAWYLRFTAYRRELGRTTATGRWRRWIAPHIGPKPIASVTRDDIEDIRDELDTAIRAWLAEGKGPKRIAGKTAMNVWSALTTAFKAATTSKARHLRVREDNPCVGVEPPGDRDSRKPRRKTFLYPKEAAALLACPDVPLVWRECHAIAVYTYLRPGELRVLTWADVDLDAALVSITKAWDYREAKVKPPKTRNGVRRVPIEPALVPLLRRMREGKSPDALVVPILSTFRGGRAAEDQLAIVFRRHLEAAEVKRAELHATTATHVRSNFRSWRDSGLTWLAMTGLGVDKISRRAGHDMIQTTMGYVKQAEDLTGDLGEPFAPLPAALVKGTTDDGDDARRPLAAPPVGTIPIQIGPAIGPTSPKPAEGLYRRRDSNPHVLAYGGF